MEEILNSLKNKEVDVTCSNSVAFRGTVESVESGVVRMTTDEEKVVFLNAGSVVSVMECENHHSRPGFVI